MTPFQSMLVDIYTKRVVEAIVSCPDPTVDITVLARILGRTIKIAARPGAEEELLEKVVETMRDIVKIPLDKESQEVLAGAVNKIPGIIGPFELQLLKELAGGTVQIHRNEKSVREGLDILLKLGCIWPTNNLTIMGRRILELAEKRG